MKNNRTISVWLILKDGGNKGKVVLQKRSSKEKNFPFICQATWSGKIEADEAAEEAVDRECEEELGRKFFKKLDISKLVILPKSKSVTSGVVWECFNYIGEVSSSLIEIAKIHKDAFPNFIFVDDKDKIYPIKLKKDPKNNIVLFNDQYKIIKRILNGNKRNNK